MPIIINTKDRPESFLQIPDQFVSDKEKQKDSWIKSTMDYWRYVATKQFQKNKRDMVPNYELVNGIIKAYHYSDVPEDLSFTDRFSPNERLPNHIKHYCIITAPRNEVKGEMSKRPDNAQVKDFSDDGQSKQQQFRTDLLNQYFMQQIEQKISEQLAEQGIEGDEAQQQMQQLTEKEVKEKLSTYNSLAEQWGWRTLESLKMQFSMKEKSEDGFSDLFTVSTEAFHIEEDNSPTGFNCHIANPKNVWKLSTPNEKYISDPLDYSRGAYAAGIIQVMELSEILYKYKLSEKEIKHLKDLSRQSTGISTSVSPLVNPSHPTGAEGITYDTYDPALLRERLFADEYLNTDGSIEDMDELLGISNEIAAFGNRFIVNKAYWCSKKLVGELSYIDENGQPQTSLVDENYKSGMHPQETSLEWEWTNQWYEGLQIGPDIYYVKPFTLLPYCPIIGVVHEGKNTRPSSYVDMMKPFQMLYNIWMNKAFEFTQKDKGNVILMNKRHVPLLKDAEGQESVEIFEAEMDERGIAYVDDSVENAKGPTTFNQYTVLQASRIQEILGYIQLAQNIKSECWELLGFSRQRLGSVQATETATATNAALSQSYAQTESLFSTHEYVMNKVYQAILDAAQYIESAKPESVVSYVNSEGQQAFLAVNGPDLKLPELRVFLTSRGEDQRSLNELKQLSQAMLQNGASIYEVGLLHTSKSIHRIMDQYKELKEKNDAMIAQQQQMEQQKQEAEQQAQQQQIQMAQQQHAQDQQFQAWQKELDRISKEKIAIISATGYGKVQSEDANNNGIQDILESNKLSLEQTKVNQDYQIKLRQLEQQENSIRSQMAKQEDDRKHNEDKIAVEREKMANDLRIQKMQAKNKPKAKK